MQNCSEFLPLIIARYTLLVLVLGFVLPQIQKRGKLEFFVLGGVLLAGFGNVLEQAITGCVSDPFDFFGLFYFNLRDVVIVLGTLILCLRLRK